MANARRIWLIALCLLLVVAALGHAADSPVGHSEDRSDKLALSQNKDVHGSQESDDRENGHYVWWQPHPIKLVTLPTPEARDGRQEQNAPRDNDHVDVLHYTEEHDHVRSSNVDDDWEKAKENRHLVIGRLKKDNNKYNVQDRMFGDEAATTDLKTTARVEGEPRSEDDEDADERTAKRNGRKGRNGKGRRRMKGKRNRKQKNRRRQRMRNRMPCAENDVCPAGRCCVQNRKGLKFCRKSNNHDTLKRCQANCQCKEGLQCFVRARKRAKITRPRRFGHCISVDFVNIGPGHFMTDAPSTPPPERV